MTVAARNPAAQEAAALRIARSVLEESVSVPPIGRQSVEVGPYTAVVTRTSVGEGAGAPLVYTDVTVRRGPSSRPLARLATVAPPPSRRGSP